jgi:beta-ureidopropionase / N-carbamoyl-L-amino-acid hydrolase
MTEPIRIDPARMLGDLRELATFGALDPGVERLAFGPGDQAAREWLAGRMREAGLDAEIDGIGNVYGRAPGAERAVLLGSHTDTVPRGGWLDGALGVIGALEVARAHAESSSGSDIGVDVISFADEEGTFLSTLGSSSFCGVLDEDEFRAARSRAGQGLEDAIAAAGYAGRPLARLDPERHRAFIELHIEQGPRLEAESKRVGAVTGITGMRRRVVSFIGRADHAGTTPMGLRLDAGAALVRYATLALERLREHGGPDTVWNIGRLSLEPGASNVVPGRGELLMELRDIDNAVMERLEALMVELDADVARETGLEVIGATVAARDSTPTDARVVSIIEAAAATCDAPVMRMPSGAGHDARVLGRRIPVGMLFVPSIGGRSHDVTENTSDEDLVLGVEVLAAATGAILAGGLD